MSIVERALKRLQTQGAPRSVRTQNPVARVTRNSQFLAASGYDNESIVGKGRIVEFSFTALSEAGAYSEGNSVLTDEYRLIKQPLLKKAANTGSPENPRGNLVMVASALAGEGKTFSSVNLSLSMAKERDWQVMLVDVDCRNPQLSELLGVSEEPGIMDVLRDPSIELESVVMPTNIEGLSVLPVGNADNHSAEYLASSRMESLCERLTAAAHHQIVVFDSSPLLLTPEPSILSSQVGQVVLVVLANATPQQAVLDAIAKLDADTAIGLILNKADRDEDILKYGSYSIYGRAGSKQA